jgi:hypothetical protein
MSGSAGGVPIDPSALAGATGSMAAAAPGAAGGLPEAWTPPSVTGGTASLYGAPGAVGGMDPGAPPTDWLTRHPKMQEALLQYGAQLMNQQRQQQAPPPAMPIGPAGHWQPPSAPLPQGMPGAPGPVWGGYRGPY